MRLAIALVVGCACLVGGTAQAAPAFRPIFYGLNADGSGELMAAGNGSWSWQACSSSAATSCAPFGTGQFVSTGTAPPGTVFVGSSSNGQTGTSPAWGGNVASTAPPSIRGPVRANTEVTPVPGSWTGGWEVASASDATQLAACARPDGTDCTSLTAEGFVYGCPGGAAVIDPVFAGWYLRVADQRRQSDYPAPPVALFLRSSPYGVPVWAADPTTSVSVVGRIAPASGPRVTRCGGPPLPAATNPRHVGNRCPRGPVLSQCPLATLSPRGVAQVWCGLASCVFVLRVRHGPRAVAFRRKVRPGTAPTTIRLSAPLRRRIGAGPATITITANGARLARRLVTL